MRATIKDYTSPDIDLDEFFPENPGDFGFLLQIYVGPRGEESQESFEVFVCTSKWIGRWVSNNGPLVGRGLLLVEEYSLNSIKNFLEKIVESFESYDWEDMAKKISRIGRWEFEEY
ncbi:immunity 8 family protein [Actinopolyspora mortivallis]|nr:immunity 8 family protein [Actinopolyspora mortivallis]